MNEQKEESKSIRINVKAYEDIRFLQERFAAKVGFVPSITQIVEYLVTKEMKDAKVD